MTPSRLRIDPSVWAALLVGLVDPFGEDWLAGGVEGGGSGIGPSVAKHAVVRTQAKIPARTLRFKRFIDVDIE